MQKIALPRNLDATPIWNKDGLALIGLSIRVSGALLNDERLSQFSRYAYLTEAFGYDVDRLVMVNKGSFRGLRTLYTTDKYVDYIEYVRDDKGRLVHMNTELTDICQIFITDNGLTGTKDTHTLSKDVLRMASSSLYAKTFSPESQLHYTASVNGTSRTRNDLDILGLMIHRGVVLKSREDAQEYLDHLSRKDMFFKKYVVRNISSYDLLRLNMIIRNYGKVEDWNRAMHIVDLVFGGGRITASVDEKTKLSTEDAKTLEWLVNNQIVPKSQEEFDILLERIKKQFYHPEVIHETIPLRAV